MHDTIVLHSNEMRQKKSAIKEKPKLWFSDCAAETILTCIKVVELAQTKFKTAWNWLWLTDFQFSDI